MREAGRIVLRVLKLLHHHPEGLHLKALAAELSLPRDKARKALQVAWEEGFVVQDPLSKKYLIRYPHPFLELPQAPEDPYFYQELAQRSYQSTGHRAYILTLRPWGIHPEATYGHRGQRVWPVPGEQGPVTPHAHASAGARAILAHMREEALRAHLFRFPPKPYTSSTPSTVQDLMSRLEEVRRLGYARAKGELIPNRCGLAVPLKTATGEAFGAVGLSLPKGKECFLDAPESRTACRKCLGLSTVLKEVVSQLWPSSEA